MTLFFSAEIKDELAKVFPDKRCCKIALLSAFFKFNTQKKSSKKLVLKSPALARLVLRLTKDPNNLSLRGVPTRSGQRSNLLQKIKSPSGKFAYYIESEILPQGFTDKDLVLKKKCCQNSYTRGLFLLTGSVNSPKKNYHLEWSMGNLYSAKSLMNLLAKQNIKLKIFKRRRKYVVYTKNADVVSKILNTLKAHHNLLYFEEVRALKETKSEIQRVVNFETANLSRTAIAAFRQIRKISFLKEKKGLEKLPINLIQTAKMRLKHPQASLQQLGNYFKPRLSKSSVSSSLRALEDLADELRNKV